MGWAVDHSLGPVRLGFKFFLHLVYEFKLCHFHMFTCKMKMLIPTSWRCWGWRRKSMLVQSAQFSACQEQLVALCHLTSSVWLSSAHPWNWKRWRNLMPWASWWLCFCLVFLFLLLDSRFCLLRNIYFPLNQVLARVLGTQSTLPINCGSQQGLQLNLGNIEHDFNSDKKFQIPPGRSIHAVPSRILEFPVW